MLWSWLTIENKGLGDTYDPTIKLKLSVLKQVLWFCTVQRTPVKGQLRNMYTDFLRDRHHKHKSESEELQLSYCMCYSTKSAINGFWISLKVAGNFN